jgi:hypothetical protein
MVPLEWPPSGTLSLAAARGRERRVEPAEAIDRVIGQIRETQRQRASVGIDIMSGPTNFGTE